MKGRLVFGNYDDWTDTKHKLVFTVPKGSIRTTRSPKGHTGFYFIMENKTVIPVLPDDQSYCNQNHLAFQEVRYIINNDGFAIISRPNREQFPTSFLEYITGMSFEQLHKSYDAWRIATGDYEAKEKFYQS